jgi:hypothetical protein
MLRCEARQSVWSARYIDAPILQDRDSDNDGVLTDGSLGITDSGLDERVYYLTDANMNVTALVDTSGNAVERYYYGPYGNVTMMDGSWTGRASSSYDNPILFCGYYRDSETGLYHVRNRMYQLSTRFTPSSALNFLGGRISGSPRPRSGAWRGTMPGTRTSRKDERVVSGSSVLPCLWPRCRRSWRCRTS